MTRRERAESRVVAVFDTDGNRIGFLVRGWHPGQQILGPFATPDAAIAAALENTAGLARGQRIRQERRTR